MMLKWNKNSITTTSAERQFLMDRWNCDVEGTISSAWYGCVELFSVCVVAAGQRLNRAMCLYQVVEVHYPSAHVTVQPLNSDAR